MTQPTLTLSVGLHLDGQRATQASNRLGDLEVGPLGLLTILETQTGLLGMHPSQAERVVQYRDCLNLANTDERFFHRSFEADELGTAAALLAWRDQWHLHGWHGDFPAGTTGRLADMAAVEVHAAGRLSPSVGERLAQIAARLAEAHSPIACIRLIRLIRLIDPLETFPLRWQQVLRLLPCTALDSVEATGEGFLGELQANLLRARQGLPVNKLPWRNDGSVSIARGETRFAAGAWLARQLSAKTDPTLILVTANGQRLDDMLINAGMAGQGLAEASAFRPSLQVLSLALEIIWQPLNCYGMVQFLTHPVCPLPRFARRLLAAKMADSPGIGGASWDAVLKKINAHYGDKAQSVRETISYWLECERYDMNAGAPVAALCDRVERLVAFFAARLGEADASQRSAYQVAHAQCRACADALHSLLEQGLKTIRPRQVQKLVAQATSVGARNPQRGAQVGAQLTVTHPGAVIYPIDRLAWWELSAPSMPSAYPWSVQEIAQLAQAGVELPSSAEQFAQCSREWLRPLLAVRKQALLVLPPEGEEAHPIWQMIEAVVSAPVVLDVESLITQPASFLRPVTHRSLPSVRRWWQLPDDIVVPRRGEESFSSLELFAFNPYHWVLKYPAALRPTKQIALGADFLLLGNLAHGLVERYFLQPDALSLTEAQFDAWFSGAFECLIDEEGAILRMPGRGPDLASFRHRLHESMRVLRQHITRAKITRVVPEMLVKGQFSGGALAGSADLVMYGQDGSTAIVDMKWSGTSKYSKKLKDNRHLQLGIYAAMLEQMEQRWPGIAYYILDRARFIAPDDRVFPGVDVIASASGENSAELWQRFLKTWAWRRAQLDTGLVEVAIERIPSTDESDPPDDALSMEYLNESYNDYAALAGWDA